MDAEVRQETVLTAPLLLQPVLHREAWILSSNLAPIFGPWPPRLDKTWPHSTLDCVASGQTIATAGPAREWRAIIPALSDAVLFNPGMGLYLAGGSGLGYQPEPDARVLSLCDIVYFRPTWNDLEADGPGAGFDAYFDPIFDFWVWQRGKRVAFRVMSQSTHYRGNYTTPKWAFDCGVPSVPHRGLRGQAGPLRRHRTHRLR